jgi:hypothetical protein
MEYAGTIDLFLGILWMLAGLIFATFLVEFGKDELARPIESAALAERPQFRRRDLYAGPGLAKNSR